MAAVLTDAAAPPPAPTAPVVVHGGLLVQIGYLYLLLMMLAIAGILSTAMVLQYAFGEIPCPLCLLQRVAMFGAATAIAAQFRHGFTWRNVGISQVFTLLLLVISVRQTLLDISPRPGHEYIGTAVLGLHMPVWSIIIAFALIAGDALAMLILGGGTAMERAKLAAHPRLARAGEWASRYLILICAINLVSVVLQCGLGQCHTMGYRLLGTLPEGAS
jgi:disulfide bond formation protein DsbB